MPQGQRVVTLLSDFGLADYFVGAMKGVLLSLNADLHCIDITHLIPPQDVATGAFTLGQSYRCFPLGTIHLAIVDPGVGTERKGLAVYAGGQYFVGPDNGLFSYVFQREEEFEAYELSADHFYRKPVSPTFHGRDIFAPVAGWLSRDVPIHNFGLPCPSPVRLDIPQPRQISDTLIQAAVLAADRFGNLITNLKPEDLPAYRDGDSGGCKILAGHREITRFLQTFGEGERGEVFVVPGSAGYLEIVVRNGSAASALNLAPGSPIGVVMS